MNVVRMFVRIETIYNIRSCCTTPPLIAFFCSDGLALRDARLWRGVVWHDDRPETRREIARSHEKARAKSFNAGVPGGAGGAGGNRGNRGM